MGTKIRSIEEPLWEMAEQRGEYFYDARRTPGSGNGRTKGDLRQYDGNTLRAGGWCVEVKSTFADVLVVQSEWFGKISSEAKGVGQIPSLYLFFGNNSKEHSAFALLPTERGINYTDLTTSTRMTPQVLRHYRKLGITLVVPESVFILYKCGKGYTFPHWRIIEDENVPLRRVLEEEEERDIPG